MGGFSFWHFLLFALIVLLLFGPRRIPQLGSAFGEAMRNYRKSLKGEADIDVTDSARRLHVDETDQRIPKD